MLLVLSFFLEHGEARRLYRDMNAASLMAGLGCTGGHLLGHETRSLLLERRAAV
jgi:hypothetical protein